MEIKGIPELLGLMIAVIVLTLDLGVNGQRNTRWREGDLKLVGGRGPNEGTVLIFHWSRWGAVCDDSWDIKDANVVCNELGYPGAEKAVTSSRYGKGRRRVWLGGLHCRGSERHLTMCYSRGWGRVRRECFGYYTSAGVVCNPKTTSTTTTTTTTEAPTTRQRTTEKPTTTTTEPTTLTTEETTTTKPTTKKPTTTTTERQTTPSTAQPTTPSTSSTTPSTASPTTPSTTSTTPSTTTTTTTQRPTTKRTTTTSTSTSTSTTTTTTTTPKPTTRPRRYDVWVYDRDSWRYYMYFRDGTFVTSRPDPRYYRNRQTTASTTSTTTRTTTTTTTTPKPTTPELDNSLSNVLQQTETGNDVIIGGADVNMLSNHVPAPQNIVRPQPRHRSRHHHQKKAGLQGDQPAESIPDEVAEDITSQSVDDSTKPKDIKPEVTTPAGPNYIEYRLRGGRPYNQLHEGRLEVRLPGKTTWGVVCGDNWDIRAAIVACHHFRVGYASGVHKMDLFGGSDMVKALATVKCTGHEDRLEDCSVATSEETPGKEACSNPRSVAGVVCSTKLPDLEPDIQILEYSAFLQDRYLYYLQCALEEGCLSSSASELSHSRGWTSLTRRLMRFSTVAKNVGTADFRPISDRSSWQWHACHQHFHSMESFSHYDIIDKNGNKMAEGLKASFCLEDTECTRGVQPKYNCQYGHQGITVGCQDSYLANIDCQWIDVTDVPPGDYTLKIELNPNMLVPEISFNNNVASCDLYFTMTAVRISNCKLTSLL